jgi:hypothetical protein
MLQHLAGTHTIVVVNNVKIDVFNLKSNCVGQDKQLHDRNYKDDRQHHLVSENLQKLFLHYVENCPHVVEL